MSGAGILAGHHDAALRGMVADHAFAVRLMIGARDLAEMTPIIMAATPLLALSLHETRRWFAHHHPEVELPDLDAEQVAWMRNSGKWFADKRLDVASSVSAFEQHISAHRAEFIDGIRLPFLRGLGRDLGIFRYDGVPILTTHGFGYAVDRDPNTSREHVGEILFGVGRAIGMTAASLMDVDAIIDRTGMANVLDEGKLTDEDVRSSEYYVRGGSDDPGLRGYLHSIWAQLGFATLLPATPRPADKGTMLKHQVVILSHAAAATEVLARTGAPLGQRLAYALPALSTDTGFRQLRNVLVHYTPHGEMPDTALDFDRPLFGTVEHHLGIDFATATAKVAEAIEELRAAFEHELQPLMNRG